VRSREIGLAGKSTTRALDTVVGEMLRWQIRDAVDRRVCRKDRSNLLVAVARSALLSAAVSSGRNGRVQEVRDIVCRNRV
jgi:hypothetical protein